MFELSNKRILVLGHRGMVGAAIVRRLEREECAVLTVARADVDLERQAETETMMKVLNPDAVILAAAKVGGIHANQSSPSDFIYKNLVIATNVLEAAHQANVNRVLVLGSSCIYPREATQPMAEGALLEGPLEPTNQWYAIAKIAAIKLAEAYHLQHGRDYISAMPTNLYGPGDNFDLQSSHVLPALMRKAHDAREAGSESMTIWGSGDPLREFMHCDDCADALVLLLQRYSGRSHVNVGIGKEISIGRVAQLICETVGFEGEIVCDSKYPDGTPRKLMDSGLLFSLGWRPGIGLSEGLKSTYDWCLKSGWGASET